MQDQSPEPLAGNWIANDQISDCEDLESNSDPEKAELDLSSEEDKPLPQSKIMIEAEQQFSLQAANFFRSRNFTNFEMVPGSDLPQRNSRLIILSSSLAMSKCKVIVFLILGVVETGKNRSSVENIGSGITVLSRLSVGLPRSSHGARSLRHHPLALRSGCLLEKSRENSCGWCLTFVREQTDWCSWLSLQSLTYNF